MTEVSLFSTQRIQKLLSRLPRQEIVVLFACLARSHSCDISKLTKELFRHTVSTSVESTLPIQAATIMSEETKSEIPEEFFCEMTKKIMRDPMVSRYGNHFEREAILKWMNDGNHYCPVSGQGMFEWNWSFESGASFSVISPTASLST